ncbi:MAG TPA: isoaspartyl peptidase/L-asparaginase [Flavobacteriaceae bacterium]|nr:isoaspartyl peptidase/L-asparaginase [Flavobacteriaceae bacterium]
MKSSILAFFIFILLSSCSEKKNDVKINEPNTQTFAIVIHGGAGGIKRENLSEDLVVAYELKLHEALNAGYAILNEGESALKAIEAAIIVMEDSPLFNAGKGAVYNSDGKQEMDAAIMDGATLNTGAVAGVNSIKNPIIAARIVKDSSKHVMLSGNGAVKLVKKYGISLVDTSYFYDERRIEQLKRIQKKNELQLDHSASKVIKNSLNDYKYGTVGAVAIDKNGNIAAGTSTGGMTNKKYGRIGDVPIIGAGTYANNKTCGISATGTGEYFIRTVAAHEVSNLIQYKNLTPKEALQNVLFQQIEPLGGEGGMILIDKKGEVYWDFNSAGMFRAYKKSNGEEKIAIFEKGN